MKITRRLFVALAALLPVALKLKPAKAQEHPQELLCQTCGTQVAQLHGPWFVRTVGTVLCAKHCGVGQPIISGCWIDRIDGRPSPERDRFLAILEKR